MNSSNSNRLREIGEDLGKPSYLIDDRTALDPAWFENVTAIGITAGASAPEMLVTSVIEGLRCITPIELSILPGIDEHIYFRLPDELVDVPLAATAS